jgi:N-acetylglucosaminyldiphosphoundecaprenol N-acetyl-beta-D-mannosaminyltransferase
MSAFMRINNDKYLIVIAFVFIVIFLFKALLNFSKKTNFKKVNLNTKGVKSENISNHKTLGLKEIIKNHVFSSNLDAINLEKRCIINTINPHSYCVTKTDLVFKQALINSDILLPDGSGIVLASKLLQRKSIKKIAGADIHTHLLKHANLNEKKVFYLGASQNTLELITKRLKIEFPNIIVSSYSPPYKSEFLYEDSKKMIDEVNSFSPDILFVGMTAPKQEKWIEANKDSLTPTIITSIGAVFDFYAGTVKRSSPFWINIGLEWLPRLIREPKRLWKRNFVSTPLFLLSVGKAKFNFN